MMSRKRVTIKEVAQAAGVSTQTVSRVVTAVLMFPQIPDNMCKKLLINWAINRAKSLVV